MGPRPVSDNSPPGSSNHARVTWWGHASATLLDSGTALLTDPVLTARVAHLHRRRGPVPPVHAARADGVLVSHLHADHLHLPSLRRTPTGVPVLVPRGAPGQVRGLARTGHELVQVQAGDEVRIGALTVRVVPAAHDGRRWPHGPHRTSAVGYVVHGSRSTYFAGDTGLVPELAGWAPGVDLALLPVAGWGPSLGPGHLDPERAAQAAELLSPRLAVPVHFGTLWPVGLARVRPELFLAPGAEFVRRAARRGVAARELEPGGSLELDDVLR